MIPLKEIISPFSLKKEDLRRHEIYRYLGFKPDSLDSIVGEKIEKNILELLSVAEIKHYGEIFPISFLGEGKIQIGALEIQSLVLEKNLQGSECVFAFGITLGIGVDRLIYRKDKISKADSILVDAIAIETIETAANTLCKNLAESLEPLGYFTKPRFSPGFADYGLENQKNLLDFLQLHRRIGVGLTQGNMMIPTKSVTALMGIHKRREQE